MKKNLIDRAADFAVGQAGPDCRAGGKIVPVTENFPCRRNPGDGIAALKNTLGREQFEACSGVG